MLIDYNLLPETSKVFIFSGSRKFYPNESSIIDKKVNDYLETLHGIDTSFKIEYDRFIIVFISDETPLTGAQTDALTELIIGIEKDYNIALLDKVKVFFKQGEYVQVKEVPDFKKLIKNKSVSKKTIVFNNFINTKSEFDCCWEVLADESWVSHIF